MSPDLERCLDDLELRLDADEELRLLEAWRRFTEQGVDDTTHIFSPWRGRPNPPTTAWLPVSVNAALNDFDLMVLQQYGDCSAHLTQGAGTLLSVRPNYGTSIISLLCGVDAFVMDADARQKSKTLLTNLRFPDIINPS